MGVIQIFKAASDNKKNVKTAAYEVLETRTFTSCTCSPINMTSL
jgi:hypothetical protein